MPAVMKCECESLGLGHQALQCLRDAALIHCDLKPEMPSLFSGDSPKQTQTCTDEHFHHPCRVQSDAVSTLQPKECDGVHS